MTSMKYVREFNEVKALGNIANYPNANTPLVDFWNGDPLPRWNGGIRGPDVNSDVGESARLFCARQPGHRRHPDGHLRGQVLLQFLAAEHGHRQ
jgi:hypothetical protein